jgi:hypothetical protein
MLLPALLLFLLSLDSRGQRLLRPQQLSKRPLPYLMQAGADYFHVIDRTNRPPRSSLCLPAIALLVSFRPHG